MNIPSLKAQVSFLAIAAAGSAFTVARGQVAEPCITQPGGQILEGCEQPNAGDVVVRGVEPNTEPDTPQTSNNDGFVLSLDGEPVDADPALEDIVRQSDIAIAEADVQVQVNTLDPVPRLDVETAGPSRAYGAGETVTLVSETNYPAFIASGEMRIIDRGATGGPRLVATVPVAPNGSAQFVVPDGADIVVVHRVYDDRGRYDETEPLPLSRPDDRGQLDGVEEGSQSLASQNIRVVGGTVTVSATDIAPGAVLRTMGETVRPDGNGRLVIERFLPAGEHNIDVALSGGGQSVDLQRPIDIAGAEWFYVAVVDLTYGLYTSDETDETYTRTDGRLQYYVDGETLSGYRITSSLDTGIGELDELFERIDDRSAQGVIDRMDASDGYPTYGDDSSIVDNTPTSGKFYLRIEQDNNFLVWGDYQARSDGNSYVTNDRSLYGLQLHYETGTTTSRGDATTSIDLIAAQPDQLAGRDTFLGTGGSVYFLRRQDITPGTATVSIELRDSVSGRVIDRQLLVQGRDYDINSVQGVITLTRPLSGGLDRRLITTEAGGDEDIRLVVQYEYTPTGTEVDGLSYGGRIETWATDDLRIGLSGFVDETGVTERQSIGADIRYEMGNNSFIQLDYAQSDGAGLDVSNSLDGGLVFGTQAGVDGNGDALKLEAQFDLADLGISRSGVVGGYAEQRELGFSSTDTSVTAATGDETLYGVFARVDADARLGYAFYADVYENDVGEDRTEIGAEVEGRATDQLSFVLGAEYLEETTATTDGSRLDVAARVTFSPSADLSYYAFAQGSVQNDGLESNDRYGVGLAASLGQGWMTEVEISDGEGGLGARLLASHQGENNSSTYFGYELDPGRALDAGVSSGDNGGRYVAGGRRQINDRVGVFGENTYDIFGSSRELISAYGVSYQHSQYTTYTASVDFGQLTDDENGDIERRALSFGVRYEDESLSARARLELRQDDYETATENDTDAVFISTDAQWTLSEEARLLFNGDFARTEANGVSFETGRYTDVSLGYAFRPVNKETLNVLARYRYFYDSVGQEVDGIASSGPVQESHVVSLEGNYDISQYWTIGGKIGGRFTDRAPIAGGVMSSNDAWLAVVNARYHLVHNWDALVEVRHLDLVDAGSSRSSFLGAAYRHINENAMIGVGYNFGNFSTDLTDLTFDDEGVFVNLVANF